MMRAAPAMLVADIPNPVDVVTDIIGGPVGWAWDKVAEGIGAWVLGAVAYFVDGVVNFLLTAARPDVGAAWFSGAGSPYATVRDIAGVLLVGFVFLGLIQGLMAGDLAGMIRRVAVDLPAAVLGMVATTVVVTKLLELTDALSAAVLAQSDGQAVHFLSGFGVAVTGATRGFAAVIVGLVAVLAGLMLWVELMVRSVLVYILVAVSPLSFAAMVWPAARGMLRRTVELLLAVILSKLVVCIAISIGVAALSGAGTAGGPGAGIGDGAAASMGTLWVGTAVLAMAAFAPFLLLKLIPMAEAALVAHGISRAPVRAAHSAMGSVQSASSLSRLAGGGTRGDAWSSGGFATGAPVQGTPGTAGAAAAGGPVGVAAAAGAAAATRAGIQAVGVATESVDTLAGGATPAADRTAPSRQADPTPRQVPPRTHESRRDGPQREDGT